MTYDELVQQVKDYLETDETTFNANIDTFIKLAEEDIRSKVQLPAFRERDTATFTASNQYLTVPTGFLAAYEMSVSVSGTETTLLRKDVSFLKEAYPTSTTGTPKYYSLLDENTFVVAPTPLSGYTVTLDYFRAPDSLTAGAGSGTTWLSENAEQALLWGTVVQAYIFLKGGADLLQVYTTAYGNAIDSLSGLGEGLKKKDSYRHGERRVPA